MDTESKTHRKRERQMERESTGHSEKRDTNAYSVGEGEKCRDRESEREKWIDDVVPSPRHTVIPWCRQRRHAKHTIIPCFLRYGRGRIDCECHGIHGGVPPPRIEILEPQSRKTRATTERERQRESEQWRETEINGWRQRHRERKTERHREGERKRERNG